PSGWSADGRQLLTMRDPIGNWNHPLFGVWLVNIDGSSEPRKVVKGFMSRFTPDGRNVVFLTVAARDASNIATVPVDSSAPPVEIVKSPFPKIHLALSPDGHFLAYAATESGARDIYLTRYPSGAGKWKVSQGNGGRPLWSRDGHTLYFVAG